MLHSLSFTRRQPCDVIFASPDTSNERDMGNSNSNEEAKKPLENPQELRRTASCMTFVSTESKVEEAVTKRYYSVEYVGSGKFSKVYRVLKKSNDKMYALKKIFNDGFKHEKSKERIDTEISLLQKLDHVNIIRYGEHFRDNNELYIELEWAHRGDLKQMICKKINQGGHFTEDRIWHYFSQIALAVEYLHSERVIHRDLKPANIMISLDETVKVGDFGLSRELGEQTLQAKSTVGTPLYMAPEVFHVAHEDDIGYGIKCDVWSMGCILYELCTTRTPFEKERPANELVKLLEDIRTGEYSPLSQDHFSSQMLSLVQSMLQVNAKLRPASKTVRKAAMDCVSMFGVKLPTEVEEFRLKSAGGLVDPLQSVKDQRKKDLAEQKYMKRINSLPSGHLWERGPGSEAEVEGSTSSDSFERLITSPLQTHHSYSRMPRTQKTTGATAKYVTIATSLRGCVKYFNHSELSPFASRVIANLESALTEPLTSMEQLVETFTIWVKRSLLYSNHIKEAQELLENVARSMYHYQRLEEQIMSDFLRRVALQLLKAVVKIVKERTFGAGANYITFLSTFCVNRRDVRILRSLLEKTRLSADTYELRISCKVVFDLIVQWDFFITAQASDALQQALLDGLLEPPQETRFIHSAAVVHYLVNSQKLPRTFVNSVLTPNESNIKALVVFLFNVKETTPVPLTRLYRSLNCRNFDIYYRHAFASKRETAYKPNIPMVRRKTTNDIQFFRSPMEGSSLDSISEHMSPRRRRRLPSNESLRSHPEALEPDLINEVSKELGLGSMKSMKDNYEESRVNEIARYSKGSNLLGSGSFGRVYQAMNKETGVLVAVKELSISPEREQMIANEVRHYQTLKHKHLVCYLGTESIPDQHIFNIFLEYCNGGSIAQLLSQFGSFPQAVIQLYTTHIVSALKYLHEHNVVHRDVKGANVLVVSDERTNTSIAKLTDFGCSLKTNEVLTENSDYSKLRGTILWMSPEAARQDEQMIGPKTDIWSLGATVIEMATQNPPGKDVKSDSYNPYGQLYRIANTTEPPEFPPEILPKTPMYDFLSRCMQPNADDRDSAASLSSHRFLLSESSPKSYVQELQQTEVFKYASKPGLSHSAARHKRRTVHQALPHYTKESSQYQQSSVLPRTASAAQFFNLSSAVRAPVSRKTQMILPKARTFAPKPEKVLARAYSTGHSMHDSRRGRMKGMPKSSASEGEDSRTLVKSYINRILGFFFGGEERYSKWAEVCDPDVVISLPYLEVPYLLPATSFAPLPGSSKSKLNGLQEVTESVRRAKNSRAAQAENPFRFTVIPRVEWRDDDCEVRWWWQIGLVRETDGHMSLEMCKGIMKLAPNVKSSCDPDSPTSMKPKIVNIEFDWQAKEFVQMLTKQPK